ncbi:hypothetical protein BK133_10975 [Paenibacillus sp. FSL H8-0548]|uniref:hypothetical protein n=1 Tax=Paenibacillus sp. FSL H8-0548 TaxID=1920422 RepID=UPI00096E69BE|nr:hypothetical protein [Paenibacillus sp. FSL H8-0548]OMF35227.1 hypothetical protein BK133_10975 [Paenibacillus sp. FSL H8-0548]
MRFVGVDPATKTGFVALNELGEVLVEVELKGAGKVEKGGISIEQLVSLQDQLYVLLQPGDEVVIEDAAPGTQRGITTGMIHGGLRSMVHRRKLKFNKLMPASVKKYVGVTGWKGEAGKKERLSGKEGKAVVLEAVFQHFGYKHKNDNIVDAYIMARIAMNLYHMRELSPPVDTYPYQIEVVSAMLAKTE